MPTDLYTIQKTIIETNRGHDRLIDALGQQDNFNINEFIIVEDVNYKIGIHPNAAPIRKLAAEVIRYSLNKYLGDDYISVAVRGDNRCSQRSLMSLALIAACRLIYQGKREASNTLLNTLGCYADELMARVNEPQFRALRSDFTHANYLRFKALLANISLEKTGITEIVLQANCDFSVQYTPLPDHFNLALSSLTAFIMDKELDKQSRLIGYPKEQLSDEENEYGVLDPGVRGSTSADRVAFLSALNLRLNLPILRVDSVAKSLLDRGVHTLEEAIGFDSGVFNLIATENDDGVIIITAFNSGGHTNLVLTAEEIFYLHRELNARRQDKSLTLLCGLDGYREMSPPIHHNIDSAPNQRSFVFPQATVVPMGQDSDDVQLLEDMSSGEGSDSSVSYTFILRCFAGIGGTAGAAMFIVGLVCFLPVVAGLGLGLGLVGAAAFASTCGLFSGQCRDHAKKSLDTQELLVEFGAFRKS